jgi:hypothetical protein
LLRYPVPLDNQAAGQTMAVGAIDKCLKRYGDETLITALQCVTQTTNNRPGMLSHEGFNMRVVEVYLLLFTAVQPFLALISPLPHPLTTRPYTVMLLVEIGPPQRKGFAS